MTVSKEELLHIVKLAHIKINDDEIDTYLKNLDDILDFADIINKADTNGLDVTIGANENYNVFRKDEIKEFDDHDALFANSKEVERGMYKIPKVL